LSSENKKKKKRLSSALSDFRKYQKKLSEQCGHFESVEEWNGYAQEAVGLIAEYNILPKNITSPVLDILNISRRSLDKVNTVCDTLDGKLDRLLDWIENEIPNISDAEPDEPLRAHQSRSQSSRSRDYGTNNMSRGSGSAAKFAIVGIIIAVVIVGGLLSYFYIINNSTGDEKIVIVSNPKLSLVEIKPSDGTIVDTTSRVIQQEFQAKIKINDRTTLNGGQVIFWIDGKSYHATPGSDGYAKVTIPVFFGEYTWTAQAAADGYLSSPVMKQKLTVNLIHG
jgi:hypothetical protein